MIQALGGEAQNGPTAQYQAILPDAVRDETEVVTVVLPTIHFQGEPGARESDVKEMDQTIQQHLMIRPPALQTGSPKSLMGLEFQGRPRVVPRG
nr:hypothetical protein [Arachnia propionica]